MGDEKVRNPLEAFETITQLRLEGLMQELTKRVRVVNEDALTHLVDRGVLARLARGGCCKPDGGTCCPNAKTMIERGVDPLGPR